MGRERKKKRKKKSQNKNKRKALAESILRCRGLVNLDGLITSAVLVSANNVGDENEND